jgi:serine/threonine-protein kinase
MIMGTPSYMAPEQARGEHLDHRADVYAAGAILYRALTGQPPFDRDGATATLVAVLTEDPPPVRLLNAEVPVELEVVIQRAMAKAPDDRYPTADDLSLALAPFEARDTGGGDGARAGAGGGARATFASLSGREAAEIGVARPALLLTAMLGLAGLAAGITTSLLGIARITRGDGIAMTGAGGALLALGVSFGVFGPTLVAAYYVRRSAWKDDARVLDLARRIVWPVSLGLGAYGFASLLVRVLEAVVLCAAIGIAWPTWDPLLFLMGLGVAVGCAVFQWWEGRGPAQVQRG